MLMRVLRTGVLLRPDNLPSPISPEDLCGSVASHFDVSEEAQVSFYRIVPGVCEAELPAAAIAAMRGQADDAEYFVIDDQHLISAGFVLDATTPGGTPCEVANKHHVDVCGVTLGRLMDLALLCSEHGQRYVLLKEKFEQIAALHVAEATFDRAKMRKSLLERIDAVAKKEPLKAKLERDKDSIRGIRATYRPHSAD